MEDLSAPDISQTTPAGTNALAEATRALIVALGSERVKDGESERALHSQDLSFHTPRLPDLVVYPGSTDEVARVLILASEYGIPVTPFGVGTSLEGHVIPIHGGISLDLSHMDRILEISPENLTATVQAGVTRLQLERAAGQHGLFFRSIRAPMQRLAAWRPPMQLARQRCATERCARTLLPSRPC